MSDAAATVEPYSRRVWLLSSSDGQLYEGNRGARMGDTVGKTVCSPWPVSQHDMVGIQWSPPHVSVYQNNTLIHQWDVDIPGPVRMLAELNKGVVWQINFTGKQSLRTILLSSGVEINISPIAKP